MSIRVLYSVYCTLPTSAQLQYDVCCLWRRHVELLGRAAAQPRIPGDARLGALPLKARGSRRLWQLGVILDVELSNICPPERYALQSTLQAITLKSNVRVHYIPRAFEE